MQFQKYHPFLKAWYIFGKNLEKKSLQATQKEISFIVEWLAGNAI